MSRLAPTEDPNEKLGPGLGHSVSVASDLSWGFKPILKGNSTVNFFFLNILRELQHSSYLCNPGSSLRCGESYQVVQKKVRPFSP